MNNFIRNITICLFFMAFAQLASAQTIRKDVVYLKNGSIIKGTILEMIPNGTLKIETTDGSIFIYKLEEVEKTTKEEGEAPKTNESTPPQIIYSYSKKEENRTTPSGYFIYARFGPRISILETPTIDVSLGIINGIHVNEYLSLGVGIDAARLSFSEDQNSSIPVYPIFLDSRFHIPRGRVNPMFSFQFGYAYTGTPTIVNYNNQTYSYYDTFMPIAGKGGVYMAIGVGLRVIINKTFSFLGDGGLSVQSLKGSNANSVYVNNNNGGGYYTTQFTPTTKIIPSLRLNLGLSVSFGK